MKILRYDLLAAFSLGLLTDMPVMLDREPIIAIGNLPGLHPQRLHLRPRWR
jgi:hypothetical protein